jgi:hypothetical protein
MMKPASNIVETSKKSRKPDLTSDVEMKDTSATKIKAVRNSFIFYVQATLV